MQDVTQITDKARTSGQRLWGNLGNGQKIAAIAVATLGIAVLGIFVLWARNPTYSAVYTNLSDEQAGSVVAKLKELKVPYQVAEGGAVLVPNEQVPEARMQLAMAGLPQGGGVGFELFDQTNFGLTDFTQKINYQRALEGELSRTINRLDAVEGSRLHLVIPEATLYTDNKQDATASVVLQLRAGRQLAPTQLRGIVQLVAGAVEGLKPENVTVLDGTGNVLSDQLAQDSAGSPTSAGRVSAQAAYEERVAANLQNMLNRIVGPGKSTVEVSAALDWNKVETSTETYSPDKLPAQIRSQHEAVSTTSGGGRSASGVPGVDSNVPTYQAVTSTTTLADGGTQQMRDTTTNYELSKRTETILNAPGGVKRLSVAVVVDSSAVSASQIDGLKETLSAAAGLDSVRGDTISVSSLPFIVPTPQPGTSGEPAQPSIVPTSVQPYVQPIAMALGPLLALLFLWILLRRPGRRVATRVVSQAQLAPPVESQVGSPRSDAPQIPAPGKGVQQLDLARGRVLELARVEPSVVAQMVQTWAEEDR